MAIKGYFSLQIAQKLEPHNQIQFAIIQRTPLFGEIKGDSQRILNLISKEEKYWGMLRFSMRLSGNVIRNSDLKVRKQKTFEVILMIANNAVNERI